MTGISAAMPLPEPIAVWNPSDPDGLYRQHLNEAAEWSKQHLPDGGRSVTRAAFYLIDAPFAVLHCVQRNEDGRAFTDPATGGLAMMEPVRFLLDELPPAHLLGRPA